jgi:uncharacterized protein
LDTVAIVESATEFVKEKLSRETTGHDWWHIYRVTELARQIAVQEGADAFICELAALFHDLADEKLVDSKEAGLRTITGWLNEHHVPAATIDSIIEIIATMSYRGGNGAAMTTIEGRVVQDADRLDAIGAIGIARTFVYAGSKGHLIFDPSIQPRDEMSVEQYRTETNTAVNHFYEKLLKLKDLMNTPYAKQLAAERHTFMQSFLAQFYKEWDPAADVYK